MDEAPQLAGAAWLMSRWRKLPLWLRLALVLGSGISLFDAGVWEGKAGDCHPGDRDGQCGLSTFAGFAEGVFAGGILLIIGWAATLVDWMRQRKRKRREAV